MSSRTTPSPPLVLTVAPNGARRLKSDHPEIPLTPVELARTAAECRDAGAAMIHVHVRTPDGRHLLDATAYRAAIQAIRQEVGTGMVIQITTEAAGLYQPPAQMAVVREVVPEAVSVGLRELVPDAGAEAEAARFFAWVRAERIMLQTILYSADDLTRWRDLKARGILGDGPDFLLFVLGRYTTGQQSRSADLLPYLADDPDGLPPWAVCAFGRTEAACIQAAITLGGHGRVGFENNLHLPDGRMAAGNADLVALAAAGAELIGRRRGTADDLRAFHGR